MSFDVPWRDDAVALFPGQGSIASGAGRAWTASPHWSLVAQISDVTGTDVAHLLLDASDKDVIRTDHAQLATFALSLVGYHDLLALGWRPRYHLGHSLGEFSALTAAGVLTLDDGARLIAVRGAAMAEAARAAAGAMIALLGGDEAARARVEQRPDIYVANVNGTGQLVVSGELAALDALVGDARDLGFKRATRLPIGGAFHSPLMAPAQGALDAQLARTPWHPSDAIVVANVDGRIHPAADWSGLLSRQLTSPIEFLAATTALPDGVTASVEMPPGAVLTGLTRRIRPFATQVALTEPGELGALA
ncbi:MAG: ACP S-malonyltransferase [Acidimicrobiales bacterium]